jgi:probable rRNA maturation factor
LKILYYFSDGIKRIRVPRKYREIVKEIEVKEGKKLGEICYIFVSTEEIVRINHEYLQHDYETDVITFEEVKKLRKSGEIYICPDVVLKNANMLDVEWHYELLRVMIHGILHILGYEDDNPERKRKIHEQEDMYMALYLELMNRV